MHVGIYVRMYMYRCIHYIAIMLPRIKTRQVLIYNILTHHRDICMLRRPVNTGSHINYLLFYIKLWCLKISDLDKSITSSPGLHSMHAGI